MQKITNKQSVKIRVISGKKEESYYEKTVLYFLILSNLVL
jgi:hypothetical protein